MRRISAASLIALAAFCALVADSAGASPGKAGLAYVTFSGNRSSVWAAGANGSHARRLGGGDSALLSPNGRMIAASRFGSRGGAMALYSAAGAVRGAFFHAKNLAASPLAWSPDSRYLAVGLTDTHATEAAGQSALDVIDTTTGQVSATFGGVISGASFAPLAPDLVVFGRAQSQLLSARTDLYVAAADGSGAITQVTHNGHSIDPVWGSGGIAFDRTRQRQNGGPVYQIVLLSGSSLTQITQTHPSLPVDGLQPVSVASDGVHLVAEYVGTDTAQAYAVNLKTHAVKKLTVKGQLMVGGFGISRNGNQVLVSYGSFGGGPASAARIASIPFRGGQGKVLAKGAFGPSWNR